MTTERGSTVRLCLTGDVMCGRGVDQILRHPGDPRIHEPWVSSARTYVELAEAASGAIPRGVAPTYVWGDVLGALGALAPDAVVVNLETAITDRGSPWAGKGIHYRMHPANVDVLTAAGIDVATLANNHVLDWSRPGLEQTLDVLDDAGIETAGAGRNATEAWAPAMISAPRARIAVLAVGSPTGGVPVRWNATPDQPGVAVVPDLSERSVGLVARAVEAGTRPGDLVILSIHWGPNWGHAIPPERRRFARDLIDGAGVHVVHGHSSHHPLAVEVHHDRLILHGCGDLLTDYEGITGHERFRGDLGGLWIADVATDPLGMVQQLGIVPTRVRRFRLATPDTTDLRWLAESLDTQCRPLGTRVRLGPSGHLAVDW